MPLLASLMAVRCDQELIGRLKNGLQSNGTSEDLFVSSVLSSAKKRLCFWRSKLLCPSVLVVCVNERVECARAEPDN